MSIRKTAFVENEYYHIYNRGNSKQIIFKDKGDYEYFCKLLYSCNSLNKTVTRDHSTKTEYAFERDEVLVFIGAYVLMPNHFHILLKQNVDGGISKFMQKISTAYSMYFNKKYERSGGLFEGKFKSTHLNSDRYLKYIFSYIHLNPVKLIDKNWKENGLKDKKAVYEFLNKYQYSSYLSYLGDGGLASSILSINKFPKYFSKKEDWKKEINTWFEYSTNGFTT